MSKKRIICFLIALLMITSLSVAFFTKLIARSQDPSLPKPSKSVITSFKPIQIATLRILKGIDDIEVKNISSEHYGCIHDFSIQASDMKKIEKANAIVINGVGMEKFIGDVVSEFPNIVLIDSSEGIELIKGKKCKCGDHDKKSKHNCKEHDCKDCKENFNTHIWLSVTNYIKQVENISKKLITVFPEYSKKITENKESYIKVLRELNDFGHLKLDNKKNREVITFLSTFDYFMKEYNLNIPIKTLNDHEKEFSAKQISKIIKVIKDRNIKTVFADSNHKLKSLSTICAETNVNVKYLESMGAEEIDSEYEQSMTRNFNLLDSILD